MNFSELVQAVIDETKRPDLLTQTQSAVRAATLKAHQKEYFYKDIIEEAVEFTTPDYVQSFKPTDINTGAFPRYKSPAYVRLWLYDPTDAINLGRPGPYLKETQIGNLKDNYGYDKTMIYYPAGDRLNMRAPAQISHILFGFYTFPDVTEDGFNSWIAVEQPNAIVYEACRRLFNAISYREQASTYEGLTAEEYTMLTINNVPLEGQ